VTRRPKAPRINATEELFAFHCRAYGLPPPIREYEFAGKVGRKYRFDFAWPDLMVAVEIEGLVVRRVEGRTQVSGRHASITGMREDMFKYNLAAGLGWCVLRFEQSMVKKGDAVRYAEVAIIARQDPAVRLKGALLN
jgi:very-short-patch-repair endonuclease